MRALLYPAAPRHWTPKNPDPNVMQRVNGELFFPHIRVAQPMLPPSLGCGEVVAVNGRYVYRGAASSQLVLARSGRFKVGLISR